MTLRSAAPLLLAAVSVVAPEPLPGAPAEVVRLADGIYVRVAEPDSAAVSNSAFVVLERGVLVFDSHFTPEAGRELAAEIRRETSRPIRYLVNSHFHPDHTHGNQALSTPGVDVLATVQTRRDVLGRDIPAMQRSVMVARAQLERLRKEAGGAPPAAVAEQIAQRQRLVDRLAALRIVPPIIVALDGTLLVADGARRLELRYLGRGHTDGDLVVVLPDEKIAFAGDLFFPDALPNMQDAYPLEWITTARALLALEVETYVPGHGRPGDKAALRRFISYLEDLKALVEPAVARGDPLEQVIRELQVPPRYADFKFQAFFAANVEKMYLDLKAAAVAEAARKAAAKPQ